MKRLNKQRHSLKLAELHGLLSAARELVGDLSSRLLVTIISAHFRTGQISKADAAKACMMTEDNFMRAQTNVDDEARRMLKEVEGFYKPVPFTWDYFNAHPLCVVVRRDGTPMTWMATGTGGPGPDRMFFKLKNDDEDDKIPHSVYTTEGKYCGEGATAEEHPFDLMIRGAA